MRSGGFRYTQPTLHFLRNYTDAGVRFLAQRLEKYRDEIFTFLCHPEVPPTNNHVEREILSAVLMRKIIYGNRSDQGADPSGVDDRFPHPEIALLQSPVHPRFGPAGLRPHGASAAFPAGSQFRRVTCYDFFIMPIHLMTS